MLLSANSLGPPGNKSKSLSGGLRAKVELNLPTETSYGAKL